LIPLHNHTHYSSLDGLSTTKDIAARIKELGLGACACTDHDIVAGHIDFYTTLAEEGIKPILGVETYQAPINRFTKNNLRDPDGNKAENFHLILLAQNDTGLKNLWALNTEAHSTGFHHHGRVDWELLYKYNEGIICTSACALGLVQESLKGNPLAGDPEANIRQFLDIFGDRFYLELSTYPEVWQYELNLDTIDLARTYGIPLVYANDAHYARPDQYDLHEVVLCVSYREKVKDQKEPHHKDALYIMGEEDVRDYLGYLPENVIDEAISNSDRIGEMCNVNIPEFRRRIPHFIPDKGYATSKEMLFDIAQKGYEEKIASRGLDDEVYLKRFEDEMKVIYGADLVDYFLIVRDYIEWARAKGHLIGPGRGSVGGSLVAYLLGITEIDPIRYGLIFERFYNIGRERSLPDIDTDFPTGFRDEVKDYLAKKYGAEYVSELPNNLTMKGKAAIQKLSVALGVPKGDADKISAIIGRAIESGLQPKWDAIWVKCGTELEPFKQKYPELFTDAELLYGHIFSYGIHASAVIVGDEVLAENYPLRWNAKHKKMFAQWDMRIAEKLGYMKMDLLGLRNLDTLEEVNRILVENGDEPIDFSALQYEDLPEEMYEFLEKGWTVGLFQIEDGDTPKKLCKDIKPRSIEDLALITALNRPGPLIAGADRRFINGRNGGDVTYIHPLVEQVTLETFGEFIYQEQVIKFFEALGYDLKEADSIRKNMGKKEREAMQAELSNFMKKAQNHMDEETATKIWDAIENFSKYAFNKSHSVGYGLILLWTLYAKWKHPRAFLLGGLRTVDKKEIYRYIQEAQRMKIPVLGPELNKSKLSSSLDGEAIRYGYNDVKHVGVGPARWLVKHGPFESWDEVLEKARDDKYKIVLPSGIRKMAIDSGQVEKLRSLSILEGDALLNTQEELLGVALSDNSAKILEDHKEDIEKECTPLDKLDTPGEYTIAGIIQDIRRTKTRAGKEMAFVKIQNDGQEQEVAVWNSELDRLDFIWRRRTAVVAQIKVNSRGTSLISARVLYGKDL
jgi:DNA polymerase-3 subunit alpha